MKNDFRVLRRAIDARRAGPPVGSRPTGRCLRPEIKRLFKANWCAYRVRKVWRQLDREGLAVARCTIARPMKEPGIQGIIAMQAAQDDHPRQKDSARAGQGKPAVPRPHAEIALSACRQSARM